MRNFINIITEATEVKDELDLKSLMAEYHRIVDEIVESAKKGKYPTSNPLAGVIHAINHYCEKNKKPNPLMGMAVATGRRSGTIVPTRENKYIPVVMLSTTGFASLTKDEAWVPKKYGAHLNPGNYVDPFKKKKMQLIYPDFPDNVRGKQEMRWFDHPNGVSVYFELLRGETPSCLIWTINHPDVPYGPYVTAATAKAIRRRWKAEGRNSPEVDPNDVVDALKALNAIVPVYIKQDESFKHLLKVLGGLTSNDLLEAGAIKGRKPHGFSSQ